MILWYCPQECVWFWTNESGHMSDIYATKEAAEKDRRFWEIVLMKL